MKMSGHDFGVSSDPSQAEAYLAKRAYSVMRAHGGTRVSGAKLDDTTLVVELERGPMRKVVKVDEGGALVGGTDWSYPEL